MTTQGAQNLKMMKTEKTQPSSSSHLFGQRLGDSVCEGPVWGVGISVQSPRPVLSRLLVLLVGGVLLREG